LIDRYFDQAPKPSREELSELVGTSVRQLTRILTEYYGQGFSEKLNTCRLEKAAVLLAKSKRSVQSISDELGFSSQGYFSRSFRKLYGVPPAQYRKTRP
jgi:AraC-like DNA-binding protein